jgi:hypothetical protein
MILELTPDEHARLTLADPDEFGKAHAVTLRFNRGKRNRHIDGVPRGAPSSLRVRLTDLRMGEGLRGLIERGYTSLH